MNKIGILLLSMSAAVTALAVGCGDDTTTTTGSPTTSSAASTGAGGEGGSSAGFGDMPKYGAQVDRFGRPAINTAANATFEKDMAAKDKAKDTWNADGNSATWSATYKAEVAKNLAILDALNGTCGDQLLAKKDGMKGAYDGLAAVLADDRLWVNAAGATCGAYLAVEAKATMVLDNTDCGGRTLEYDVVERSYSVLAAGVLAGVDDTIKAPDYAKGKTFPYFAPPK